MSPATRSAVMSRIRGKGTGPEKTLAAALAELGLAWEEHARDLPGRPDFVFREAMVAVFVDGDFWHGWKFNEWRDKLSEKWEAKIAETRRRDSRNQRALKKMGWRVLRIWEHQLQKSPARCAKRVYRLLEKASLSDKNGKAPRP
ncbi:very short patch repair endonuclease [Megalodesulfovibrio gigas]|uniref:very short patch repair endonuclease n=1 Tax=Megalodesulfovibrio gigas TaxID=879 RepID=UPI00048144BC